MVFVAHMCCLYFLVLSSPYRSVRSPFVFVLGGSGTPGVWFCSRCDFLVRLSVRAALVSRPRSSFFSQVLLSVLFRCFHFADRSSFGPRSWVCSSPVPALFTRPDSSLRRFSCAGAQLTAEDFCSPRFRFCQALVCSVTA
jgi:hypothetical protein